MTVTFKNAADGLNASIITVDLQREYQIFEVFKTLLHPSGQIGKLRT